MESQVSQVEKSADRVAILDKIKVYEENGWFDQDIENDPPTVELLPHQIDYLRKKPFSKLKTFFANKIKRVYVNHLVKRQKLIIKDVIGIDNWKGLKSGAVITCNHFGPEDSFIMEKVFQLSKKKKLFKVIREGNYTNPPVFKFFMRNCDTLPLSKNFHTMGKCIKAIDTILQRGDNVLIYPEESMWWNYRKPRPLKTGGFKFAVKNNVPVLPIFITMEDSDKIGDNGFALQSYTVHILKPIYPDESLDMGAMIKDLMQKNYDAWVEVYEKTYEQKLTYATKKD
ncbi:MAG: 1-acyl-sn-glycerol-3-phosphate acyltransferase [Clostridia bacterium]|nr:1-acyl-sn-glycerol-3-phosphate acyltransferase [Clostridia bacterium]